VWPYWASAAGAADISGTWLTDDGASKVDVVIAKAADGSSQLSGKVVWLKDPTRDGKPLTDLKNEDAALRGRPIMGLPILTGFKSGADGHWVGGMVYAPRAGKSYPAELSLATDGRLQLKVNAGLLSKTDYWTR
jgi:uncharacterized protein (DUF2147 family)